MGWKRHSYNVVSDVRIVLHDIHSTTTGFVQKIEITPRGTLKNILKAFWRRDQLAKLQNCQFQERLPWQSITVNDSEISARTY